MGTELVVLPNTPVGDPFLTDEDANCQNLVHPVFFCGVRLHSKHGTRTDHLPTSKKNASFHVGAQNVPNLHVRSVDTSAQ